MPTLEWDTPMLVSGIILAATFIAIFTERLHDFDRPRTALAVQ